MAKQMTGQFKQKVGMGGMDRYQLINNRFIRIRKRRGNAKTKYTVDLLSLDPDYKTRICINWGLLIGALLIGSAAGTLYLDLFQLPDLGVTQSMVSMGLAAVAGIMLILTVLTLRTSVVYQTMLSGIPAIMVRYPLIGASKIKKEANEFLGKMNEYMLRHQNRMQVKEEKQKSGELRVLRRLLEAGVVSKSRYDEGRTILLGNDLRAAS